MKRKLAGLLSATLAAGLFFSSSITTFAAPKVSPYTTYEAEKAVTKTGVEVATEGDISFIKGLEADDSFSTVPFTFENGAKSLSVVARTNTASWVDIHIDKVDGEKIGSLRLSNTNGEFKAFTANVSNVEGSHTLYFVGKRGDVDVDNFVATPAEEVVTPEPVDPEPVVDPVATTVNPYELVEAETASERKLAAELTTDGITHLNIRNGGYAAFKNVDFSKGIAALTVTCKSNKIAVLEVRVDSLDGAVLSNVKLNGSDFAEKTVKVFVEDLQGSHDLYFVPTTASTSVLIDSWKVMAAPVKPDPVDPEPEPEPVDPEPVDPEPITPDPVVTTVNPYELVEAEASAEKKAAAELSKDGVTYLSIRANGYAVAKNVDFSKGAVTLVTTTSSNKPATLEVRLDGTEGTKIAGVMVSGTDFTTRTSKLSQEVTGSHDVYFMATTAGTSVNFDSWKVMAAPVKPDPVDPEPEPEPVDPDPIVVEGDLALEYTINSWGTGYTINFKIANNTDKAINGWTLKLKKSEIKIDSSWCAKVTEDDEYYIFTPETWNSTVNAHDGAYIGLVGSGSIGTSISYTLQ